MRFGLIRVLAVLALGLGLMLSVRGHSQIPPENKPQTISALCGAGADFLVPADFEIDGPALAHAISMPATGPGVRFSYSFVHLADIQLRERGAGLYGELDGVADGVVESMQNEFCQDNADSFYAGYALKAARMVLLDGKAAFAIHTGDAIHMGLETELETYNKLIERFLLKGDDREGEVWQNGWLAAAVLGDDGAPAGPYYFNALGNHDVFFMGNWMNGLTPLMPTSRTRLYLRRLYGGYVHGMPSLEKILVSMPGMPAAPLTPASASSADGRIELTGGAKGYYYFDLDLGKGQKARMISLNTTEVSIPDMGLLGAKSESPGISKRQFIWLSGLLEKSAADPAIDHVLIFGHHPASLVTINQRGDFAAAKESRGGLLSLFAAHPKVVAYFCGHDHSGSYAFVDGKGGNFLHVSAPSVMEYPKTFTVVRVESDGPGAYSIVSRYVNLEDMIEAGAVDSDALFELGLVVREREFRYPVMLLDNADDPDRAFPEWMDRLDTAFGGNPAARMLYLALQCLEGAIADAGRVERERMAEGEDILQQNWSWELWRGGIKADFESERRVERIR